MIPIGSRYSRLGEGADSSHGIRSGDQSMDESGAAAEIDIQPDEEASASSPSTAQAYRYSAPFLSGQRDARGGAAGVTSGARTRAKYGKIASEEDDESDLLGADNNMHGQMDSSSNPSDHILSGIDDNASLSNAGRASGSRDIEMGHLSSSSSSLLSVTGEAVVNKMHEGAAEVPASFIVRVQNKESRIDLSSLRPASSVLELAVAIEAQTGVPLRRQRLVLNGRSLELRSTISLESSGVKHMSCVHLFQRQQDVPLPEDVTPSAANARRDSNRPLVSVSRGNLSSILTNANQARSVIIYDQEDVLGALAAGGSSREMVMEAYVRHLAPEVRLWCYVLFFSSIMTLTDKVAYISDTGTLGETNLDALVGLLEIILSMAGAYVAVLGFHATQEMTRESLHKYVSQLTCLAYVVAFMRVLWVYDVLIRAKQSLEDYAASSSEGGGENPVSGEEKRGGDSHPAAPPTMAPFAPPMDSVGDDDLAGDPYGPGGELQVSSESMLIYFSIQVIIVAAIYTFAWVFCVSRAVRLRSAFDDLHSLRQERRARERRELDALVAAGARGSSSDGASS